MVTGLTIGAACSLSLMKDVLRNAVSELPEEKTKIFCAVLQQLRTLGGEQIRNVAVCCMLFSVIVACVGQKLSEIASDHV